MMKSTANVGDTQIKMLHKLSEWKVGDQIIISSTDWNHLHAERRIITQIATDSDGNSIIHF